MASGLRCMVMRGGSSKGLYFVANDLPSDPSTRDQLLLSVMGSPDPRQIDGMGGAHPLTSKVAIVQPSSRPEVDLDYLFLQVGVDEPVVSDSQNCGNLLAGVGPFAVERGLVSVDPAATEAEVRIHMENTDSVAVARFATSDGEPVYAGDAEVAGVPGTAAPIQLEFTDVAGGTTGALLPTGRTVDHIDDVACTLIDNGMPVVVMAAGGLGMSGYEPCADLEADSELRRRLESIRLQAGQLMGLGDVTASTVPKLTLVAPPNAGGHLCTRTFIPHRCHDAIGVLGAVSVATAALLPDTPANHQLTHDGSSAISLEHPTGRFDAVVELSSGSPPGVNRAGIVRTARKLMDGEVFAHPPAPTDR